jgi:hypothetical protein
MNHGFHDRIIHKKTVAHATFVISFVALKQASKQASALIFFA